LYLCGSKLSLNMKRLALLIMLVFMVLGLAAQQVWTVQTVPNTRIESNEIHVSDPDGYLSDSAEMNINTALCAIRDQADVFLVTLSSIGDADPKHFATELLNYWGIGDAETNNGVLLLFVEDQHALEFETGYGAEATLTDAKCERIFTNTIVPYFRAGDYEGGLCAGVGEIVGVYGGEIPLGLVTTLPNDDYGHESDADTSDISAIFLLFALFMLTMPVIGLVFWLYKRQNKKKSVSDTYQSVEEDGITYINGFKTTWSGSPWENKGCLGGMMLGLSPYVILFLVILFITFRFPGLEEQRYLDWVGIITIVLCLTWICFRHNHRVLKMADGLAKQSLRPSEVYTVAYENKSTKIVTWMAPWLGWIYRLIYKKKIAQSVDCRCPVCLGEMEKNDNFALPEVHAFENSIGALNFQPYLCENGHRVVVKEKGSQFANYSTCQNCGAFAVKKTKTETLREADYSHNGKKEETYECQHCGHSFKKAVVIPMLYHYSGGSSGGYSSRSSSGRSYHSSSHSSRGSFGGGRSGGGGYSGRW